ncbi:reverse transcriptase domain-containing protein [Tanacetum coccineum]
MEVPRVHGDLRGNLCKSKKDENHYGHAIPQNLKRDVKLKQKAGRPKYKNITKEYKDEYRWTEEAERAFQELKKLIIELPLLTTPKKEEVFREKLCSNGEASLIIVEHVTKATELEAYNITYEPRNVIKGHVIADFLSEAPVGGQPETFFRVPTKKEEIYDIKTWTLFTDGASNSKGSGASLVLISPSCTKFTYALRLNFTSTNNKAEYEALLAGLRIAAKMKVQFINVNVDSKLVASQISRSYVAKNTSMIKYLTTVKECITGFKNFTIQNIPRKLNQKADILSKLANVAFNDLTKEVLVEVLSERTNRNEVSIVVEEEEDNWMTPIIKCPREGVWPEDKNEAMALRMKINQYVLERGVLFKKRYQVPMLICVDPCSGAETSKNTDDIDHGSMAILPVGNEHLGSVTPILCEGEVRYSSHRLLHKMD